MKRSLELAAGDFDIVTDNAKRTLVVEWFQSYVDEYELKDIRNMQGALNRFKDFLKKKNLSNLTFGKLSGNDLIISDFQDYLIKHSIGEGANSYFARFKKMMKRAFMEKLMFRNGAASVKTKKRKARRKDTLTIEELELLSKTPTESTEVKRAFLFCTVTGLRWCDVYALKWENIHKRTLEFTQGKTNEELYINLNDTAIKLLGERQKAKDLVFDLPTANGANKSLKAWTKRAGLDQKITFHNARHSFGTNLINNGVDVLTASKLLGHTTMKHTQRYVDASNAMQEQATNKLNFNL